ncbi:MAG: cupin domain-containing protein [Planctomycetota bacterium]|jgi:dTDP-4-dehydrorhamnose 3,5-epimerase-like enzyme
MARYLASLDAALTRDERGIIYRPSLPPEAVRNLHVAELLPGAVRGNHVHGNSAETVIVHGSKFRVVASAENGDPEETLVGPEPVAFTFPPGIAHAFENAGETPGYLICLYDRDEPDQEPFKLI